MPASVVSALLPRDAIGSLDGELRRLQAASPLEPVWVLTPTVRSGIHLRQEILDRRRPGALANVRFVVLPRFAESLGGAPLRAAGLRRLTRADLGAALRTALPSGGDELRDAGSHPAGEAELVERYEELRAAGGSLSALAAASERGEALASIFASMRSRLSKVGYDDVDLCASAEARIGASASEAIGAVVAYQLDRLRSAEAALLRAVAERCELVVMTAGGPGACSDSLAADLLGATRATATPRATPQEPVAIDEMLAAPDPASEVREAVRLVLARLASGTAPERVGIFYASALPYAPLLTSELDRVGIAYAGRAGRELSTFPSARFLLGLLGLDRRSLGRSEVIALAATAPPFAGRSGVEEWDRASRLAGIVGGSAQLWRGRLAALAEQARRRIDEVADSTNPTPRRAPRTERAAVELTSFVTDLDSFLERAEQARGWRALAACCRDALGRWLGSEDDRCRWPGTAGSADALVGSVLEELSALDDLEDPAELGSFRRALALALARPGPNVGRLGSGLVVGNLEQAAALDLDLALLLGAAEGALPSPPRPSPLLSPHERELLGLEGLGGNATLERDRRRLWLVAVASTRCVALFPTSDRLGRPASPTRLLSAEAGRPVPGRERALRALVSEPSAALDEHELVAAELSVIPPRGLAGHRLVRATPSLAAAVNLGLARRVKGLGPYSGRVGIDGLAARVATTPFSPTSLEEYATCPFRYFLGHLLSLEVVEDPQARLFIDARDRGSIVHEVLERFVRAQMDGEIDADAGEARLAEIAAEVFVSYERRGRTGKAVLWELERRRLLRLLERERVADLARRAMGTTPLAVEHTFGLDAAPPVSVKVAESTLQFRGKIDRVDSLANGGVEVIDYKTGRADGYRGLADDPVDRGRHLQLAVYALAARDAFCPSGEPVSAAFRFLEPAISEIAVSLGEPTRLRFEDVLSVLVTSVNAGLFPYRPGEAGYSGFEHCRFCDYDSICAGDRSERWEASASVTALAPYRALVEGEPDWDEDEEPL